MKKNFLKATIPLIMMGSPTLAASSIRSGSRWRVNKAVVQGDGKPIQIEESTPLFVNPFGGFNSTHRSINADQKKSSNVLNFLAKEGLLHSSLETKSIISGNKNKSLNVSRKEFLDTSLACVPGATYRGMGLQSIYSNTSSYGSFNTYNLYYIGAGTSTSVPKAVFDRAKAACNGTALPTNSTPVNVPTLSQWAQYLLMLLLALIGSKTHLLRKPKVKR